MSGPLERVNIGAWPTPVERLDAFCSSKTELWVKHDGRTHPLYGGNKVRKLEYLLAEAKAKGATRLLTIGAAGSHHVLATAIHGQQAGFRVGAVLVPQPSSPHVIANLRAALGAGLEVQAVSSRFLVPSALLQARRSGDYVIPPGGSSVVGSAGYLEAAAEIAIAVQQGSMPEPDAIVVALGSGGTVAGLLAGVLQQGLRSVVVGVLVATPALVCAASALMLAWRLCRRVGINTSFSALRGRLHRDSSKLGRGYGYSTPEGMDAIERAQGVGLQLEPTYTAKAFAQALAIVEQGAFRTVLYLHTLSSAALDPFLAKGPTEVPEELRRILL